MVQYNPLIGAYSTRIPWVPTPTEIMRRAAILDMISSCTPGSVLEIGCGSGALLYDLSRKNYWGKGVDTSNEALKIARSMAESFKNKFHVGPVLTEKDKKSFDYVIAIAVLEHIKEDGDALKQWREYLKKKGVLILSVPAHQSMWGKNDELAGHYRRYERSNLVKLVEDSGFSVRCVHSYGFPVLNIHKFVSKWISGIRVYRGEKTAGVLTKQEATAGSGIERPIWQKLIGIYSGDLFKPLWMAMFALQRIFYKTDNGSGYVLIAGSHQHG